MDIKIVSIRVVSDKFGTKKILKAEDGLEYKVTQKQKFYNDVKGPGVYEIRMGEYKGHPFVEWASFKSALPSDAKKEEATKAVMAVMSDKRIEMDKRRQNDIRLEFYCGLVKDVMIANKKKDEDIKLEDIMPAATALYKDHIKTLDILDVQEEAVAEADKPITAARAEAEIAKAKAAEDEEPPF